MSGHWLVSLTAPDAAAAAAAAAALDAVLGQSSMFEDAKGTSWRVEGLCLDRPDRARLALMLELAWAGSGGTPPAFAIERVATRDWLAENQAAFPPLRVGRYFVHGGHWRGAVPAGSVPVCIDAATAFGTGEHASTRGCLLALDRMARRGRRRRILDMGTGTGILAMAAAKTWHGRVAARDIDPESVRVARRNAAVNGVAPALRCGRSGSYAERAIRRAAPFDLVTANILARPLIVMAHGLARVLQCGGVAVLSGLLARQAPSVLAAHRRLGMVLVRRIDVEGWHTLVLARGFSDGDDAIP